MGLKFWQVRIGLAQEDALIALQVDRSPALAVLPQLFVAAHVFGGPADALEFLGAAFINLQQVQPWSLGFSLGSSPGWLPRGPQGYGATRARPRFQGTAMGEIQAMGSD